MTTPVLLGSSWQSMEISIMKPDKAQSITEIFLDGELIDRAIRKAAREALRVHQQEGRPVAVWQDGRTVWLSPEESKFETRHRSGASPNSTRGRSISRENGELVLVEFHRLKLMRTAELFAAPACFRSCLQG